MATELSTDDTPQKQNLKIDCKCCRSVVALLQVTENHIMKLFEEQNENHLIGTDVFQVIFYFYDRVNFLVFNLLRESLMLARI
jgi:hypothetical protein